MNPTNALTVRFWGVRGSHPAPNAEMLHFGGNTPCVEIQAAGKTIIFDAGTGIIPLGRRLAQEAEQRKTSIEAVLLLSHLHHDHIQGFPFFTPAYAPRTRLYIYGPQTTELSLNEVLAQNMNPPVFPVLLKDMPAYKEIRGLNEHQMVLLSHDQPEPLVMPAMKRATQSHSGEICVRVLHSDAHPGGVFAYRLEWWDLSVVYATDIEGYEPFDRRLASFACGADLLIHDAQYTQEHYLGLAPGRRSTQGWGHSTVQMACKVALESGVHRLALFHYEPTYSDPQIERMEAEAMGIFPNAFSAREGQQVMLTSKQENWLDHHAGFAQPSTGFQS